MGTDQKITIESVDRVETEYCVVVRWKNGKTNEVERTFSKENAKYLLQEEMDRASQLKTGGHIKVREVVYSDWRILEDSDIELITEEVTSESVSERASAEGEASCEANEGGS
jgi:hypothetical protein